jgi:hypothetical protein
MTQQQIIDERERMLYKLNQYTGALEELTFLSKNQHLSLEIYNVRFDRIMRKFEQLKEKFDKLGEQYDKV